MSEAQTKWRARLATPALGALVVACCLGLPLIVAAASALTAGHARACGGRGRLAHALPLFAANRMRSDRRC